jgi:hypothetical protein
MLLMVCGCAGSSKYMIEAAHPTSMPAEKAVVYFLRPSGMGFGVNFQIWDRDKLIGVSQAKSCFRYLADPGKHLFLGIAENKVAVAADVQSGKTYHIIISPRIGRSEAWMVFEPVLKGSENWEDIGKIRTELQYIEAKPEELAAEEVERKQQAQKLVRFFEEWEKYMVKLSPEDGR